MQVIVTNNRTVILLIAVLLAIPTFGASIVAYMIWSHMETRSANYEVIRRAAFADMDEGGSEIVPTWYHNSAQRGEFISKVKGAAERMSVSSDFLNHCFTSQDFISDIFGYAGCMEQRGATYNQQARGTAELLRDEWMALSLKDRAPFLKTNPHPAQAPAPQIEQTPDSSTDAFVLWSVLGLIAVVAAMFVLSLDRPTEEAVASSYEEPVGDYDRYTSEDIITPSDHGIDDGYTEFEAPTIRYEMQKVTVPGEPAPELAYTPSPMSYDTIEKATKTFVSIYNDRGYEGARGYSQKCHKAAKSWPTYDRLDYCVAFDLAAAAFDYRSHTQGGTTRNQYFKFQSGHADELYEGAASYEIEQRVRNMSSSVSSILETLGETGKRSVAEDASDPYHDIPDEGKERTEMKEIAVFP